MTRKCYAKCQWRYATIKQCKALWMQQMPKNDVRFKHVPLANDWSHHSTMLYLSEGSECVQLCHLTHLVHGMTHLDKSDALYNSPWCVLNCKVWYIQGDVLVTYFVHFSTWNSPAVYSQKKKVQIINFFVLSMEPQIDCTL